MDIRVTLGEGGVDLVEQPVEFVEIIEVVDLDLSDGAQDVVALRRVHVRGDGRAELEIDIETRRNPGLDHAFVLR